MKYQNIIISLISRNKRIVNIILLLSITLLSLINQSNSYYIKEGEQKSFPVSNFSFGSCYNSWSSKRMDAFKYIKKLNPELFIWMGDAAYLDSIPRSIVNSIYPYTFYNKEYFISRFNVTYNNKDYKIMRETTPVIGVWDDHDYGQNDGNAAYEKKEEVKQLYLDLLEEPLDSRRRNNKDSIDAAYSFGEGVKSYKVILLDTRYNKDRYFTKDKEMISEQQWEFLENELKSNETFTFIVSGTQILPITRLVTECWFDKSRERLFELIGKLKKSGVVLLSGDVHFGEMLKTPCIHPSKLINMIYYYYDYFYI